MPIANNPGWELVVFKKSIREIKILEGGVIVTLLINNEDQSIPILDFMLDVTLQPSIRTFWEDCTEIPLLLSEVSVCPRHSIFTPVTFPTVFPE